MTTLDIAPEEVIQKAPTDGDDDEVDHISCHCTEYKICWGGQDVSHLPPLDCDDFETLNLDVLCRLAWEMSTGPCPWGCSCEECSIFDM